MAYLPVTTHLDVVDPGDSQLTLREAIAQANTTAAADTIRFVATLAGETLVLTGGELTIRNDLTIDGGSGGRVTIDADGESRVLRVEGSGTDVSLRNLGVTGGYGDYDGGAGIRLGAGSGLSLSGCDVSGNIHGYDAGYGLGGGILATANNRVTIADTTMADNRGREGGAVAINKGGQLTITDSFIHDNIGLGINIGFGGGVRISDSTANISGTTISDNLSAFGGGIHAGRSVVRLTNSTLAGNAADYRTGYISGGGIGAFGSGLTILSSTITGNRVPERASSDGAGVDVSNGSLAVANSIIAGNFQRDFSDPSPGPADDISGAITLSNGHNVFGSEAAGSIAGDRENVAPGAVFATIDPETGGGRTRRAWRGVAQAQPSQPRLERRRPLGRERLRPARHQPPAAGRQSARPGRGRDRPAAFDQPDRQQRRAHRHRRRQHARRPRRQRPDQEPGRQRHHQCRPRQRHARRRPRQRQAQRRPASIWSPILAVLRW